MNERLRFLKNPAVHVCAVVAVAMGSIASDCRLGSERPPKPTPITSGTVINKWYEPETYRWETFFLADGTGISRRVVDDDEDFMMTIRNCNLTISDGTTEPQLGCIDRTLEVTPRTFNDFNIGDPIQF